jgi:hypothetical protein
MRISTIAVMISQGMTTALISANAFGQSMRRGVRSQTGSALSENNARSSSMRRSLAKGG